jgi:hypothetical protein
MAVQYNHHSHIPLHSHPSLKGGLRRLTPMPFNTGFLILQAAVLIVSYPLHETPTIQTLNHLRLPSHSGLSTHPFSSYHQRVNSNQQHWTGQYCQVLEVTVLRLQSLLPIILYLFCLGLFPRFRFPQLQFPQYLALHRLGVIFLRPPLNYQLMPQLNLSSLLLPSPSRHPQFQSKFQP